VNTELWENVCHKSWLKKKSILVGGTQTEKASYCGNVKRHRQNETKGKNYAKTSIVPAPVGVYIAIHNSLVPFGFK
jgi:hypothetical protein